MESQSDIQIVPADDTPPELDRAVQAAIEVIRDGFAIEADFEEVLEAA